MSVNFTINLRKIRRLMHGAVPPFYRMQKLSYFHTCKDYVALNKLLFFCFLSGKCQHFHVYEMFTYVST